jgi:hypothetical protein
VTQSGSKWPTDPVAVKLTRFYAGQVNVPILIGATQTGGQVDNMARLGRILGVEEEQFSASRMKGEDTEVYARRRHASTQRVWTSGLHVFILNRRAQRITADRTANLKFPDNPDLSLLSLIASRLQIFLEGLDHMWRRRRPEKPEFNFFRLRLPVR